MKANCEFCGKDMVTYPSLLAKGKGRFCSPSCSARHSKPEAHAAASETRKVTPKTGHKVEMTCDGCGKTFREYPSRRPKPMKFCTRQCGIDWQQGRFTQDADTEPILTIDRTSGMTIVLDNGQIKQI